MYRIVDDGPYNKSPNDGWAVVNLYLIGPANVTTIQGIRPENWTNVLNNRQWPPTFHEEVNQIFQEVWRILEFHNGLL